MRKLNPLRIVEWWFVAVTQPMFWLGLWNSVKEKKR